MYYVHRCIILKPVVFSFQSGMQKCLELVTYLSHLTKQKQLSRLNVNNFSDPLQKS